MYGLWALPFGLAVAPANIGVGIGGQLEPPPLPGCVPVYIACDSQGKFGHKCPNCEGYWRSGHQANVCPYCGWYGQTHEFLSTAQQRYVQHYCEVLAATLQTNEEAQSTIDMDKIVQAALQGEEKPDFYVLEESQQCQFTCTECNEENDILGRFGYCPKCGTRNDWNQFKNETAPLIRELLNAGQNPEDQLRDAVSKFDSFASQYAKQLTKLVPLTARRIDRLTNKRFHNLQELVDTMSTYFDIDICAGMSNSEQNFASLMFLRRHVYEHNGGEVDQIYLDESGDSSVRLKQHISESKESVHNFLGALLKIAKNIHEGFHSLFPPLPEPIKAYEEKKERIERYKSKEN